MGNVQFMNSLNHVEANQAPRTVRPGAAETQNDFFHIPLLFISLNEGEISE